VDSTPNNDYSPWVSQNVYAMYQSMFAIITPALIIGSVAERDDGDRLCGQGTGWVTPDAGGGADGIGPLVSRRRTVSRVIVTWTERGGLNCVTSEAWEGWFSQARWKPLHFNPMRFPGNIPSTDRDVRFADARFSRSVMI